MLGGLKQYKLKRNFKNTSEPSGKVLVGSKKSRSVGGLFVIHKHDATRLHYDLRLEHKGVLWCWAVTRAPSLDPLDKRLAVHVDRGRVAGVLGGDPEIAREIGWLDPIQR